MPLTFSTPFELLDLCWQRFLDINSQGFIAEPCAEESFDHFPGQIYARVVVRALYWQDRCRAPFLFGAKMLGIVRSHFCALCRERADNLVPVGLLFKQVEAKRRDLGASFLMVFV